MHRFRIPKEGWKQALKYHFFSDLYLLHIAGPPAIPHQTTPSQLSFQISLLYSLIVLSEEKKPAFAMFISIIFFHFSLSL